MPPWLAKTGEAAASIVTSIMAAATSTATLFHNTSSVLLPQGRDNRGRPAELYNATTVASMRYYSHPPYGLFSVVLGRCLWIANFYEKAHFVKSTWRLYVVAERNSFVPFALCFYPL